MGDMAHQGILGTLSANSTPQALGARGGQAPRTCPHPTPPPAPDEPQPKVPENRKLMVRVRSSKPLVPG